MFVEIFDGENIRLDIRYASDNNLLGRPIYKRPTALLATDAAERLKLAAQRAAKIGMGLKIFDAFRPLEVQWIFWEALEDKTFVGDPRVGGTHPRGIAVDLTLFDLSSGVELDMGTDFDALDLKSSHGAWEGLTPKAIENRAILLGLMTATGWVHYEPEWWHYNLPNVADYPVFKAADVPYGPL